MIYAVIHDLSGKRDYSPLYERIKALGAWMHYIDSLWVIQPHSLLSANQIYQDLEPHIDKDEDYLLVIEVSRQYAGLLPKDAWEWLSQREWQQPRMPV